MKKSIILLAMAIAFLGCKSKLKQRELGAYDLKTSCVSSSGQTLLVVAWGRGKTKEECENNALKRAITDVVFKGIYDGSTTCTKPAILTKPNAEKEYEPFFKGFLSEEGKYREYATLYNEPRSQHHSKKIRKLDRVENMALEFQIEIDRGGLIKLLQNPELKTN